MSLIQVLGHRTSSRDVETGNTILGHLVNLTWHEASRSLQLEGPPSVSGHITIVMEMIEIIKKAPCLTRSRNLCVTLLSSAPPTTWIYANSTQSSGTASDMLVHHGL